MTRGRWQAACVAVVVAMTVAGPGVSGQTPAPKPEALVGSWEGVSKGTNGELPLLVELKLQDGRFVGVIGTPGMTVAIASGTLQGDALTLDIDAGGTAGTVSAKVTGPTIEGTWQVASESGTLQLSRKAAAAASGDVVSGEWSAEAMAQGQPMPFQLVLTLDGEVVTGDIVSPSGRVPLTKGTWKDGMLTIWFPYVGGEPVQLGGKIENGKLDGIFDFNNGEMQGTWSATKR